MITEQLIRHNQAHHEELLREAASSRLLAEMGQDNGSLVSETLARTGDLLVAAGQGLQRRYRRMEAGVALSDYNADQRLGRAL